MSYNPKIITTEDEIIIHIPRKIVEKRKKTANIGRLRGLMKGSRFAGMGSVRAQHAVWQKER